MSGCESGWTSYLDQSSLSKTQFQGFGEYNVGEDYARLEDEEEDLSMVSDASSGPPHYCEDDEYCYDQLAKQSMNKKKNKERVRSQQQQYLDDTASSLVLSKKVTKIEASMEHTQEFSQVTKIEASMEHTQEFSQGFSATHCKGKSAFKKHFGFFQSSKSASKEPGGFQGRNWK